MFPIPNTTISSQSYVPAQTFECDSENVSGYLFCSGEPVYVRLTVGLLGAPRLLPEFFMAPGAQAIVVQDDGEPVTKVEVRAAGAIQSTPGQFWGVLATKTDPLRSFTPINFSINSSGGFVPPIIQTPLIFQHNAIQVGVEGTLDFEDSATNSILWVVTDDAPNGRVKVVGQPNLELDYVESVAAVAITAVTLGTAQTILTSNPLVIPANTNLNIEYFIPRVRNTTAGQTYDIHFVFFDSFIGSGVEIAEVQTGAGDEHFPVFLKRRYIPAAGNHTFSLRAFVSANGATVDADGGNWSMYSHVGQNC
jgi:hypothetical protein